MGDLARTIPYSDKLVRPKKELMDFFFGHVRPRPGLFAALGGVGGVDQRGGAPGTTALRTVRRQHV